MPAIHRKTAIKSDDLSELEEDFAILAQLAASESPDAVRLLLAKMVRKYRMSHPVLASRFGEALRATPTRSASQSVLRRVMPDAAAEAMTLPIDSDSRNSLIRVFDDLEGLEPPLLTDELDRGIQTIIKERQQRSLLETHGMLPTRSAILVGPPGVGKTLSARWIAFQLGKPLWVLDLTTVMSSLLGKTGNNLRAVFDHAKRSEAVLLLDEVDAIAKRRSDESDVGELKRLVTAILQEVDAWPSSGLLLAATNHPELVDPALWRRFDHVLHFDKPPAGLMETAVRRFLGSAQESFSGVIPLLAYSMEGLSLSDVERAIAALRRAALLDEVDPVDLAMSLAAQHAHKLELGQRRELAVRLAKSGFPHDKIRALTGVSRDTIRKHAGPSAVRGRPRKDT
ncbi:AAA family ATPase [Achromobacter pulmonis]|uniref:AAA family ATPase n=1 Tax=Achromobacter pulmonis TaxID=1389932 RepID=UPI001F157F26|nr:ATP-binding protein [Achromobacter pulmonis]